MSDSEKKCNICSKKANVFLSTVIEYEVIQVSFCQEHAETSGLFDPKGYCFLENEEAKRRQARSGPLCPQCQCSLKDFQRSGKLGCMECYETFHPYIQQFIAQAQKGPLHFGKIPSGELTPITLKKRIKFLKEKLKALIQSERFEQAAQLRDYMQVIEKQLKALQDE